MILNRNNKGRIKKLYDDEYIKIQEKIEKIKIYFI